MMQIILCIHAVLLTLKAPNTTIAEFTNTVGPDETAHNGRLIRIYSVCTVVFDFQQNTIYIGKFFRKFADVILSSAFLAF